jgi:taurine dioxygenase
MSKVADLKVTEVFSPFGAVVAGIDFRKPSPEMTAAVKRLLAQHHVLVSRTHATPGDEDITNFFEGFGELSSRTPEVKAHFARLAALVPEYLENGAAEVGSRFTLSNVEEDGKKVGGLGNRELEWHNDQADLPRLKTISCLEALDFQQGAGNTFFCDTYVALETLPLELRKQLDNVFALHDSARYKSAEGKTHSTAPASIHPVVLAHPETGRRCLYVNPSFTSHIVGLTAEDSQALLDRLYAHAHQEQFVFEHQWRTGDIVIWDNVGLQHMRPPIDPTKRRTLRVFQGVSEAWTLSPQLLSAGVLEAAH